MEHHQARRILQRNQQAETWSLDQLGEVTEWLRDRIFSRPAKDWSEDDIELCQLWVTTYSNKSKCIAYMRRRVQDVFAVPLPVDIAKEGFNEGFVTFFTKRFLRYDPGRDAAVRADKEKMFMMFFRTCALNAAVDYFARQLSRRPMVGDNSPELLELPDEGPLPDRVIGDREAGDAMRQFRVDLDALIERRLAGPEAERAAALLRDGTGVKEAAKSLGLPPIQVTEIRHATILSMLKDGAVEQAQRDEDEDFGPVYSRIAGAIGVSYNDVRVYVFRARNWAFARIGDPFFD